MNVIPSEKLDELLHPIDLVEVLRNAFRRNIDVPARHHHSIAHQQGVGTLLLMPAWSAESRLGGVKMVSVYPSNAEQGLPSIYGTYILFHQTTGVPLAVMDGRILTLHRTAAASVLASSYLARKGSERLLMVGTGQLAPYVVRAYTQVLHTKKVFVWGRTASKAGKMVESLREQNIDATAVDDLEAAAREADIISCATLSRQPLVRGEWLKPGAHVDLIGGFTYEMRESDDDLIRKASVFVDTIEGALSEAGDLLQPIAAGVIAPAHIQGDLFDLTRETHPGRTSTDEITCFKSVGTALEDLAAAELAFRMPNSE